MNAIGFGMQDGGFKNRTLAKKYLFMLKDLFSASSILEYSTKINKIGFVFYIDGELAQFGFSGHESPKFNKFIGAISVSIGVTNEMFSSESNLVEFIKIQLLESSEKISILAKKKDPDFKSDVFLEYIKARLALIKAES